MPLDYQNSVIYKICCKDHEIKDIYVGSTTSFKRRMSNHKSKCNNEKSNEYNYPVYRFIRDTGGFNNWSIVKIRDVVCKDKYDLIAEERKEFEKLGATLNSHYPERSIEEWREKNKEHLKQRWKEYISRPEVKEKKIEYHKKWYQENKEQIKEYNKEYIQKNKEHLKQRWKEYREKNKEEISKKKKEKVECPCGSIVRKDDLSRHKKTQKHQNYLKTLQDN